MTLRNFTRLLREKTVDEVLNLAREYIFISKDEIKIIKYWRKSLQYYNEGLCIKKGVSGDFDNPMGAFDGS